MDNDAQHTMTLTSRELMLLRAGLKAYLTSFDAHRARDGGQTHPESQWREVQRSVGVLIWRLEEAGVAPGTRLHHSAEAVDPATRDN
ncbi:hypothetical protein HP550_13600 [Cellulomonas humilata]|uniref:Uncharacterized protein n=1 Tax=Cellulomonas humilata TaxID=144055 RepID=A0A7Y6A210_9CELL|nr:hypothetical protein [Cellulomonas humilata]NUU18286.1 hypothetical protein [Cellulomonas humilata]